MSKKTRPTEATSKSNTIVNKLKSGQTPAAGMAEMMVGGLAVNAVTAVGFSKTFGELNLGECVTAMVAATQRVNGGDLAGLEAQVFEGLAGANQRGWRVTRDVLHCVIDCSFSFDE